MNMDVRRAAELAKLRIEEAEIPQFEAQMKKILAMVEHLPELTGDMAAPKEEDAMLLREDVAEASLSREALLQNAPKKDAGCISVPKTV